VPNLGKPINFPHRLKQSEKPIAVYPWSLYTTTTTTMTTGSQTNRSIAVEPLRGFVYSFNFTDVEHGKPDFQEAEEMMEALCRRAGQISMFLWYPISFGEANEGDSFLHKNMI